MFCPIVRLQFFSSAFFSKHSVQVFIILYSAVLSFVHEAFISGFCYCQNTQKSMIAMFIFTQNGVFVVHASPGAVGVSRGGE